MRLKNFQIEAIKKSRDKVLWKNVKVFLFWSRVDDNKKWWDIDLFIDDNIDYWKWFQFSWDIKKQIWEQKIDVLIKNKNNKNFIDLIKDQFVEIK